nr:putative integron gene cassette protein [uncultured bacterium]
MISNVRPVQKQMPVNKRQAKAALVPPSPRPSVSSSPQTPCRLERPALRFWVWHLAKSGYRH